MIDSAGVCYVTPPMNGPSKKRGGQVANGVAMELIEMEDVISDIRPYNKHEPEEHLKHPDAKDCRERTS